MRTASAAWAQIASRPSRLIATVVTIVIGIGFACAALVFTSTFRADFTARLSAEYAGSDIVVTPQSNEPSAHVASSLTSVPGVASAEPLFDASVEFTAPRAHNYMTLHATTTDPALQWAHLVDGSWPTSTGQIAVSRTTATAANLSIGTTLTVTGLSGPNARQAPSADVTVVGIADTSEAEAMTAQATGFVIPAQLTALGITHASLIAVLADPGADLDAVVSELQLRLRDTATVRSESAQADHDVALFTGQTNALTSVLLGFAAIALIVAGIVISTTFSILLAGRRRQIALLRCVGATGKQVRREALVEAGIVGAVGSAVGAGVGIAIGALAARLLDLDSGGIVVPPVALATVTGIGILLTIGAVVLPASRAMRVRPLQALRPVSTATEERSAGRIRLVVGLVPTAIGGSLLAVGVAQGSFLIALGGGAVSAVGVLILTRSFLPPLLRLIGGIGRLAGVPGRLAAGNAVRNPGRAAATSAALIVGVGLMVMLQVGAASAGASVDAASRDQYPVDVSVVGDGSPLPTGVVAGVRATSRLAAVAAIPGADATVALPNGDPVIPAMSETAGSDGASPADSAVTLMGVPTGAASVARGGMQSLDSGTADRPVALVPSWWVGAGYVDVGGQIVVTAGGRSQHFTVAVGHLSDAAVNGISVLVTESALTRLDAHAAPVAMWAALDDPDHAADVMSDLNALLANEPGIVATGSAADRASLQSILGTVTTVTTGLLAVAVVIAIVGIGNTIGLSVIERTRESALLRALGLRRGQLRLTLAFEAVLLALLGGIVGIGLGLIYGWAGAASMFGEIGQHLVLSVPWGMVGLILVLAAAAGALASVLPARRAAKTPPVAALAEE